VRQWLRATVATPGEWQCKTGGVRRLAVANGSNIFQMLLVIFVSFIFVSSLYFVAYATNCYLKLSFLRTSLLTYSIEAASLISSFPRGSDVTHGHLPLSRDLAGGQSERGRIVEEMLMR